MLPFVLPSLTAQNVSIKQHRKLIKIAAVVSLWKVTAEVADFTKGYIKSKHAMVVLNLLLQYNKEVNSN